MVGPVSPAVKSCWNVLRQAMICNAARGFSSCVGNALSPFVRLMRGRCCIREARACASGAESVAASKDDSDKIGRSGQSVVTQVLGLTADLKMRRGGPGWDWVSTSKKWPFQGPWEVCSRMPSDGTVSVLSTDISLKLPYFPLQQP